MQKSSWGTKISCWSEKLFKRLTNLRRPARILYRISHISGHIRGFKSIPGSIPGSVPESVWRWKVLLWWNLLRVIRNLCETGKGPGILWEWCRKSQYERVGYFKVTLWRNTIKKKMWRWKKKANRGKKREEQSSPKYNRSCLPIWFLTPPVRA